MTPERNRFEIGWVMVSPRGDGAGMVQVWRGDASYSRQEKFFIGQMLVANDFISIFVD